MINNKITSLLLCSVILVSTSNSMNSIDINSTNNLSEQHNNSINMENPIDKLSTKIENNEKQFLGTNKNIIDNKYIMDMKQSVIDVYKDFITIKSNNNKKIKKKLPDIISSITQYTSNIKSLLQEYEHDTTCNNSVQNMICQYIFDDMNSSKSNDHLIIKYRQLHHYYIGNTLLLTMKNNKLENNNENVNELSWFTNHILNNVENNNNYQWKNGKSDSNYKNFVNNLENNINLMKQTRNELDNNIIVTNDVYESRIDGSFIANIQKIQNEYIKIKNKISKINIEQYMQVLTQDYNGFLNKLNQYVTNINTINQDLYKDQIMQIKKEKEKKYEECKLQDVICKYENFVNDLKKLVTQCTKTRDGIFYNLTPVEYFDDVFNKLNIHKDKNALIDCWIKFFKVRLIIIDYKNVVKLACGDYKALQTIYNQVKKYSFTEEDETILNQNINRIAPKYLSNDNKLRLNEDRSHNEEFLLVLQENEQYINCLNTIISKLILLVEKYFHDFIGYFKINNKEVIYSLLDIDETMFNFSKFNFGKIDAIETIFKHLQDVNIDCNDKLPPETSDNIDKIVEFIDSVSKMEDKYHDIKKIFNIVSKMNIETE